ncbi:MAG: YfaZ family outer membrane protein [Gammaproteobacteria bacterium]|jgi:hypothetical protein|nr:YfaZ family outer membrane protein [Gammaproteobacteria bacterium]
MTQSIRRAAALLPLIAGTGFGAPALADIDLNLNDDAALVRYLAHDGAAGNFSRREMDAGLLYTTDRDYLLMFGAQLIAEAGASIPELEAGVGLKAFGIRFDSDNMFALAIGGQLRYSMPPHRRLVFGAEGYYAPDVVTSSPAENFSYFNVYAGYEVVPEALVYVGYRDIGADLRNRGDVTIDSGGHVGVRFAF